MPVLANPLDSRLQLKLRVGTDENGKAIIRTKSLNSIKPSATNQDVMDVAQAISALQQHPVSSIVRINEEELMNA
ncbi:MAG: hypothetical protein PWR27_980 [Petroclostridium sp.]|jgi:hypothetical protein|uniref:DUF1659 domain-containing protein n=1 Tax=Petroclostridium xylanilyticum TaxID=1792311 RepID=UPI000B994DCD|nr:DUF1659 domain-containing protein [Petroclostridium xylanilyticum]MBZ4646972.1 hypothetical protein [Clostridia bacterium]MDK2810271.1 hypothetical protein [Petroclostridium sp.]